MRRPWRVLWTLAAIFLLAPILSHAAEATNTPASKAPPRTAPVNPVSPVNTVTPTPIPPPPVPPATPTPPPPTSTQALSAAAEQATYDAAIRDFDLGLFGRAANAFAAFEFAFPESQRKDDVALRRAFAEAASQDTPDESTKQLSAFAAAYPKSPLALNALLRASRILQTLKRPDAVVRLLDPSEPALAHAVSGGGRPVELYTAFQMRAEAALSIAQPLIAVSALEQSAAWSSSNSPASSFERLRLLLQAHQAAGNNAAAVRTAESLKSLTDTSALASRRADAISLLGGALLREGNRARATGVFHENLIPGTPLPLFREATLQVADADRRAERYADARSRLEGFIAAHPDDPQLEGLRWSLAQTLYAQYQEGRARATNNTSLLALAELNLSAALTNAGPELRGDLQLLRGWCHWEGIGGTNALAIAGVAFAEAVELLPKTTAQAAARFKLADVQYRQGNFAAALTNYLTVAEGYPGVGDVEEKYSALAWQQAVASAVESTNLPAAERAMEQLISRNPRAEATGLGLLQVNDEYQRHGQAPRGRKLLDRFIARVPNTPLRAELELSIADSLQREELHEPAYKAYTRWLADFPNHTNRIRAELGQAFAYASTAGMTNAVDNFVILANRYPGNPLTQAALLQLGNHYFSQQQFQQAEQAYTSILTNTALRTISPNNYAQARLSAAQAALSWKQYPRAQERLRELLDDKSTPIDFVAEAYYWLGIAFFQAPTTEAAVSDALDAFKAAAKAPDSLWVAESWLAMADCHRQLAAKNTNSFSAARELYQNVLDPKNAAEPLIRARAKVGLGHLALQQSEGRPIPEATAWKNQALEHYLAVANGEIVPVTGQLEASILRDAAHSAGNLLEAQGRIETADALYERLASELPQMREHWEARRQRLKKQRAEL